MIQIFPKQPKPTDAPISIISPLIKGGAAILTTPFWDGSTGPVGGIETVTEVSEMGCKISSSNQASNYYVNVLLAGFDTTSMGSLGVRAGHEAQPHSGKSTIDFTTHLSSNDPVVLLTPQFSSAVGSVEYLFNSAASEISTFTGNNASTYSYHYLASDRGASTMGSVTPLETGTYNKTGGGIFRVYFSVPFSAPPTVFLSPWYDGSSDGLSSIETVVTVKKEYFEAVSGNEASNFFVNWMAFGPPQGGGVEEGPAVTSG